MPLPTLALAILLLFPRPVPPATPVADSLFPPLLHHPTARAAARSFRIGNLGQAARQAWEALLTDELHKDERAALNFLHALALVRTGRRPQALTAFRKVLADGKPHGLREHAAWYHGNLLLGHGRPAGAAAVKEARSSLVRIPPSSRFGMRARQLLVRSLLAYGEVDEACRIAGLAAEGYAGTYREAGALLLAARCRERQAADKARADGWKAARDDFRDAAARYREVATVWPHLAAGANAREKLRRLAERGLRPRAADPERMLRRARQIAGRIRSRRDLTLLKRIKILLPRNKKDPARFEVDVLYGELATRYRWFGTAAATFRRIIKHAPDPGLRARAAFDLAGLTSRRRPQAAIDEYLNVHKRWPTARFAPLALYKAGEISRRYGQADLARKAFLKCVEDFPSTSAAARCRWGLAWMAFRAGRYQEASTWMGFLLAASDLFPDEGEDILEQAEEIPIDEESNGEEPYHQETEDDIDDANMEEEEGEDAEENAPTGLHLEIERRRFFERVCYWHARVLETLGKCEEAQAAYLRLVRQYPYGYYALMAWERLLDADVEVRTAPGARDGAQGAEERADVEVPTGAQEPIHPDVAAATAYVRMGLDQEARATLLPLRREGLSNSDRRVAARVWLALGDYRRSHRMAPVPWEGGLPGFPRNELMVHARLAYPRAFGDIINGKARHPDVPASLLYALMRAESGFWEKARSPASALGLTQVVRRTAYRTARRIRLRGFRFWKLFQPEIAIRVGSAHLAELLSRYGDHPALAMAAYNAGEPSVNRWLARRGELPVDVFIEEIPYTETNRYVRKTMSFYAIYRALYDTPVDRPLPMSMSFPAKVVERAKGQNAARRKARAERMQKKAGEEKQK